MNLLLTTSQSFLLLDTDSGHARRLDGGRGLYYGIARHGEHLYVAARRRLVSSDVPAADERGEILMFDRRLRPCGSLRAPFPLRDLHEIAWHDGKLYATASHDNLIAVYDGQRWEEWYPLGGPGVGDQNHLNSFMFENGLIWILAHNRGPSELYAFSLAERRQVQRIALGNCGHNMWREQGQMLTCSSAESRLLGDQGFELHTGGFPRGVAFNATRRCLGISALIERKARDFTVGKVRVYDRAWQALHDIDMAGEGLVLDLMELPAGFAAPPASAWTRLGAALGLSAPPAPSLHFAPQPPHDD
ncbi:hypothetical protein [Duganella radicis]|uniref:Uncharacterized protein n=1 Tax=Duganella radicis TaxID=551988 RepID=A0A6L6PPF1_9BURK|nr:hypothetical protein [Duganella radicis]MTV40537.1 hypothetical protein [Duganella radicis]